MPRLAVAPDVRMASSQPATPAMAPARTKDNDQVRFTLMPARNVAIALPPIMMTWRPKGVLAMKQEKTTKHRIAIQAMSGRP